MIYGGLECRFQYYKLEDENDFPRKVFLMSGISLDAVFAKVLERVLPWNFENVAFSDIT